MLENNPIAYPMASTLSMPLFIMTHSNITSKMLFISTIANILLESARVAKASLMRFLAIVSKIIGKKDRKNTGELKYYDTDFQKMVMPNKRMSIDATI